MVPKVLQPILWSRDINRLDIKKDKEYIIHQVLAYGRWQDLVWLFKAYSKDEIAGVFVSQPAKDYRLPVLNFVKNFLLGIKQPLDFAKYDRNTPRLVG